MMYGRMNGKRALYVCGRYMNSAGAECENNSIDAEALLQFTLASLQELVLNSMQAIILCSTERDCITEQEQPI